MPITEPILNWAIIHLGILGGRIGGQIDEEVIGGQIKETPFN